MCLILFAYKVHPNYPLIVASNRDEFYNRPTAPIHYWKDHPNILAGRDLKEMGTWMGISTSGRFAALTNYRNPNENKNKRMAASRGEIVTSFLTDNESPASFIDSLKRNDNKYKGYNSLIGDLDSLWYYSNVTKKSEMVKPGIYGLSNHLLDTEWPKVVKGKTGFETCIQEEINEDCLFQLLTNDEKAADHSLPQTGIPLEMERALSSLFIRLDEYGTRCSSILKIDKYNQVSFIEKTYEPGLKEATTKKYSFQI